MFWQIVNTFWMEIAYYITIAETATLTLLFATGLYTMTPTQWNSGQRILLAVIFCLSPL